MQPSVSPDSECHRLFLAWLKRLSTDYSNYCSKNKQTFGGTWKVLMQCGTIPSFWLHQQGGAGFQIQSFSIPSLQV